MGPDTSKSRRYAAFISYAHADEAMAARLHKALETYPVPRHLRAQGKTTKPVFRDVAELTAAHSLSEKIQEAVKGSRVLIVLCSPAAKASHWVNEEIRLFRELHGDAAILSAIIDGTPETAFPEALTEGGREPLAAALGTQKARFKLGVTQLAAGMLGTGLDDLVQRGAKRRNWILGAGLAASLLFSGAMGFTAYQAVDARNEAQTARGEAEGLIQYMIKDLKAKLEPVGRLDVLEGVGDKAVEYYDKQDTAKLPDDSLTRQAAARQVLAQVHLDAGRMEEAQREIEASATLTREVLARNPDDTDAIFAHAQSEYWVGAYYFNQNKFDEALPHMERYNDLAQSLYQKNSQNFNYIMEAAWGVNNLGGLAVKNNRFEDAIQFLGQGLTLFRRAEKISPDDLSVKNELANTLGWLADASEREGPIKRALNFRNQQIAHYADYMDKDANYSTRYKSIEAQLHQTRLSSLSVAAQNLTPAFHNIILELETLAENDPDNMKWRLTLLRAYIDHYFYAEDTVTQDKLRAKIVNLKSMLLPRLEDKDILEVFYAELIEGMDIPQTYQYWADTFPKDSEQNAIISSEFINSKTEFLNNYDLKKYAKVVVDHYQKNFNSIEPKAIQRLVKAHLVLGQCDTASIIARTLKKRGYKAPNLNICT